MTTVIRRRPAVLLAALALGFTLSACAAGPSQVGAAAIVGDQRIPLDAVQARIDTVIDSPQTMSQLQQSGKGVPDASRFIVTDAVEHQLLAEAAKRENLTVDESDIDLAIEQAGGAPEAARQLLTDQAGVRSVVRDQLLLRALGQKYFGRIALSYDSVDVQTPAQAKNLAAAVVANPAQSQALMSAVPGAKPNLGRTTGASAPADPNAAIQDAVDAVTWYAPANSVLVMSANQGQQGGGYTVVYIRSVTPAAPAAGLDTSQINLSKVGEFLLRPLAVEKGVRISPRYGVWDPSLMTVVPSTEAAAAGELLPAAASSASSS